MMREQVILKVPAILGDFVARNDWRYDSDQRIMASGMRNVPGSVMMTIEVPPSAKTSLAFIAKELSWLLIGLGVIDGDPADTCIRFGPEGEFCRVTVSTYVTEQFDDLVRSTLRSVGLKTAQPPAAQSPEGTP